MTLAAQIEAPHLARRRCATRCYLAADDPAHRGIMARGAVRIERTATASDGRDHPSTEGPPGNRAPRGESAIEFLRSVSCCLVINRVRVHTTLRYRLDPACGETPARSIGHFSVFRCRLLSRGSDSPYAVTDIIGNQERSGTIDGDPYRTAKRQSTPVSGSQAIPFGLRKPDANTRVWPVAGSTSRIAARCSSLSKPFSAALLFEPTVT